MPIRPRSRRRTLLPLLAALAALACAGEPATAPDSPDLARGGKPSDGAPPKVSFQNLVLESHTFVIDGASVGYTIDVVNRGKPLQGIILETRMWPNYTTGVHRAAGSTYLFCGADQGELPHGTCQVSFTAVASNSTTGAATLLPGAGTLTFTLVTEDGSFVSAGYTQEGVTLVAQ